MDVQIDRSVLLALAVVALVFGAGCSVLGDGSGGGSDYDGSAESYLLDASAIGDDWEASDPGDPVLSPEEMESGRTVEFTRGNDTVALTLLVMGSPGAAGDAFDNSRSNYQSRGADVGDTGLGDEAFTATGQGQRTVVVQQSNVVIGVAGTLPLSELRPIASAQLDALEG